MLPRAAPVRDADGELEAQLDVVQVHGSSTPGSCHPGSRLNPPPGALERSVGPPSRRAAHTFRHLEGAMPVQRRSPRPGRLAHPWLQRFRSRVTPIGFGMLHEGTGCGHLQRVSTAAGGMQLVTALRSLGKPGADASSCACVVWVTSSLPLSSLSLSSLSLSLSQCATNARPRGPCPHVRSGFQCGCQCLPAWIQRSPRAADQR